MAFWKKHTDDTQTFSDLIRGLQHSVNAAMEMLEARNIEFGLLPQGSTAGNHYKQMNLKKIYLYPVEIKGCTFFGEYSFNDLWRFYYQTHDLKITEITY